MEIEIRHRPANSAACVRLKPGERFTAEGGAMIAMDADVQIETSTHARGGGGIGRALKRALAGESFFLNHYTAGAAGGEVWLAPKLCGDMVQVPLAGGSLIVQGGSFVACDAGVDVDLGWQGLRTLFSGESLFWVQLRGQGLALLNSFGAVYCIEVSGRHIVDSGHIVAFDETLGFRMSKVGKSWITSFMSGEGLVCEFAGRGRLWCQSHNAGSFGQQLGPLLKER